MRDRPVVVPKAVRQKVAAQGAEGTRWLRGLGGVIEQLEHDWDVVVGSTLHGGSESDLAAATTGDGVDAIIKIAIPGNDLAGEATVLGLAKGHGYARLLKHDPARQAMLAERLGASLAELDPPVNLQIKIICATLRRAWQIPPPASASLPSAADKARWLARFIAATWEELNRPCPSPSSSRRCCSLRFAAASSTPDRGAGARRRQRQQHPPRPPASVDCWREVQVHRSRRAGRRTCLRPRHPDAGMEQRAARGGPSAAGSGAERPAWAPDRRRPQAIWEWGFVERVSTGLLAMQVGAEDGGRQMLEVAGHRVQP